MFQFHPTLPASGPRRVVKLRSWFADTEQPRIESRTGVQARAARLPERRPRGVASLRWLVVAVSLVIVSGGCSQLPSAKNLDLMSPSSSMLFPGQRNPPSRYQMIDGTAPPLSVDGSMTMEAYQKIREAKANRSVVLQVDGDAEPVRVLPLPPGQQTAFVSELLTQTGLLKRFGAVDVVLYRPTPESIAGVRMQVRFDAHGTIDPTTDYGLRPGDRIQVTQVRTGPLDAVRNLVLRR